MKKTRLIMGLPITIEVVDTSAKKTDLDKVFRYFIAIDKRFSTYKKDSEIAMLNDRKITLKNASSQMQHIFALAEETKKETDGYFNIEHDGEIDPSGIVKGWAILEAAKLLESLGYANFFVDAGGDIQVKGKNPQGKKWQIGIKNPFNQIQVVKVLEIEDKGVATSGTYIRGDHIYDPVKKTIIDEIVSLTVIGPNIYEADRFATAAFAMGKNGILFIEKKDGLEGYQIDKNGIATMTSGFAKYVKK